jgi:hypothetical protein
VLVAVQPLQHELVAAAIHAASRRDVNHDSCPHMKMRYVCVNNEFDVEAGTHLLMRMNADVQLLVLLCSANTS